MPNEIRQIVGLVLVLFIMASIFTAIGYSILWGLLQIYKWLFRQSWFSKRIIQIKNAVRKWWKKYLPDFTSLWEFFHEVLADPLFYGYALVVVVDRLQSISEYTKQYPQYTFFQLLDKDMNTDTIFYFTFYIIFMLWMLGKIWKHTQDVKNNRIITKSLKNIEVKLGCYEQQDIGLINKEIRENLKRIKEKET
jgi:hypothetical protein